MPTELRPDYESTIAMLAQHLKDAVAFCVLKFYKE